MFICKKGGITSLINYAPVGLGALSVLLIVLSYITFLVIPALTSASNSLAYVNLLPLISSTALEPST